MRRDFEFSFTRQEVYDILVAHLYEHREFIWTPESIGKVGDDRDVVGSLTLDRSALEDTDELITISIEERR